MSNYGTKYFYVETTPNLNFSFGNREYPIYTKVFSIAVTCDNTEYPAQTIAENWIQEKVAGMGLRLWVNDKNETLEAWRISEIRESNYQAEVDAIADLPNGYRIIDCGPELQYHIVSKAVRLLAKDRQYPVEMKP